MSEFSGYCPRCGHHEEVRANKPCENCGARMRLTAMDGKGARELAAEGGL